MPHIGRIILPDIPHHLTHRGNRRMQVFRSAGDYSAYCMLVRKYFAQYEIDILAYCLMPNHVHFIPVPHNDKAFSQAMRDNQSAYTTRFNRLAGETGHVWDGRFYSCALDESHLWAAVRYVERNPVRAGLVELAEDYPWSSARAHCGLCDDPLLANSFPPEDTKMNWQAWLREEDVILSDMIRKHTLSGQPLRK